MDSMSLTSDIAIYCDLLLLGPKCYVSDSRMLWQMESDSLSSQNFYTAELSRAPRRLALFKSMEQSVHSINTPYTTMATSAAPPSQSLYLQNLPSKVQKDDLRRLLYTLLSLYGPVLDINIVKNAKMRGQAHVLFRDVQTATTAMRACQGMEISGNQVKIFYSKNQSKALAKMRGTFAPPTAEPIKPAATSAGAIEGVPAKDPPATTMTMTLPDAPLPAVQAVPKIGDLKLAEKRGAEEEAAESPAPKRAKESESADEEEGAEEDEAEKEESEEEEEDEGEMEMSEDDD